MEFFMFMSFIFDLILSILKYFLCLFFPFTFLESINPSISYQNPSKSCVTKQIIGNVKRWLEGCQGCCCKRPSEWGWREVRVCAWGLDRVIGLWRSEADCQPSCSSYLQLPSACLSPRCYPQLSLSFALFFRSLSLLVVPNKRKNSSKSDTWGALHACAVALPQWQCPHKHPPHSETHPTYGGAECLLLLRATQHTD